MIQFAAAQRLGARQRRGLCGRLVAGVRAAGRASLVALVLLAAASGTAVESQSPASAAAAPTSAGATPHVQGTRGADPLDRIVSLDLQGVPLRQALDEIDRQAHLGLTFSTRIVPLERAVTITTSRVSAGEALATLLKGTQVHAVATSWGTVVLVQAEVAAPDTTENGTVWGQVSDSATEKPLAGAVIGVKGTSLQVTSNERGVFILAHVPSGAQVIIVRLFGYAPFERDVPVETGQPVRLAVQLKMRATRLQEVVTTASGDRRLLELGNDIVVLNADSIVATQPVASVTDLLENRVPGLVVQRTSGAPGDPARLRLEGVGSITLSNDPIVIMDGVRVYSAVSNQRSLNLADARSGGYLTPSPLDDIDVHSIARIEVFKGPAATSTYGPDAAAGVIVITTKRGQAGPPRWTANVEHGITYIPGTYPSGYLRLGHSPLNNTPTPCPLGNSTCIPDSLLTFQALNDPSTSPLTHGGDTRGSLGVSGGIGSLTYSFNGHYHEATGTTLLPPFESARYEAQAGAAPPSWMAHPDGLTEWGETAQLSTQLGSRANVSLTSMLTRQQQRRSNLDGQLGSLMRTYLDRATGTYYVASENSLQDDQSIYAAYATQVEDAQTAFTTALGIDWNPARWLTTHVNAGINTINRKDDSFEPPDIAQGMDSLGYIGTGSGASLVYTAGLQATATTERLPFGIGMAFTMGADFSSTSTADNAITGTGVPQGATSVAQAALVTGTQSSSDSKSFGIFATPSLHGHGFYLESGLRLDGGSSYGSAVHLVAFPKVSLSYLASSAAWFPHVLRSVFDDLRLRLAYGEAGREPTPEQRLRLYALSTTPLDESTLNVATVSNVGNDELKPERTSEFESGFDADLFNGRVSASFTGYRKLTHSAILTVPVAPSVYGNNGFISTNVGTIRNDGFNATLHVYLVRTPAVQWSEQLQVSRNSNVLVSLNKASSAQGFTGLLLKEGYPVDGLWAYPLLGYSDRNQDGIIEPNEVLLGDTLSYMGSPSPVYQTNLTTTIALLHNTVSLDATVGYQSGATQTTDGVASYGILRGYNDPSSPLAAQALAASFGLPIGSLSVGSGPYGNYQQVTVWRLTSLAVRWRVPESAARLFGTDALTLSLQGTNLWLRTNYQGKDPNVNGATGLTNGFTLSDYGVIPQPRTWLLQVSVAY